jgi:hypothetical protein
MNRQEIGNAINSQIMAQKSQLLNEYIIDAFNKYKDINTVVNALSQYIGGSETSITRDKNYRNLFKAKLNFQDILTITRNDLVSYVTGVLQIYQNNVRDDFNVFVDGIKATFKNALASDFYKQDHTYAYKNLIYCLDTLSNGYFNGMTNKGGYRDYFIQKYSQEEFKRLVIEFENRIIRSSTMMPGNNFTEQAALQLYYGYGFDKLEEEYQNNNGMNRSR